MSVVRWACNFKEWLPSEGEWNLALSQVAPEERIRIGKFIRPLQSGPLVCRFNPDAKSALIGRLMLNKLIVDLCRCRLEDVSFGRTKERKPFLLTPAPPTPGFNFNLSHQGQFVALAAEPEALVGVDVMDVNTQQGRQSQEEFFRTMNNCFTAYEWGVTQGQPTPEAKWRAFYVNWCLKEAYIKAVGIGLGFELQRAEFILDNNVAPTSAQVKIDGTLSPEWYFDIHSLGTNHVAASCLGPACLAMESFRNTLRQVVEWHGPGTPRPFRILTPMELLGNQHE